MQVAICTADTDERYELSRLVDDAMLRRGLLPEMLLFRSPTELLEASADGKAVFDLVFLMNIHNAPSLRNLCRRATVILVGSKGDGPTAFDIGADYFIESPVMQKELNNALTRCLPLKKNG